MTAKQMLELMSVKLNDLSNAVFTPELKVVALNTASLAVFGKMPMNALKVFENSVADVKSGTDVLTVITGDLRGGMDGIKYVYLQDLEKYATKISLDQHVQYNRRGIQDYYTTPRYYFKGTRIYMMPDDDEATITYYLNPTEIVDEDTALTTYYDKIFHNTIVDIACAILTNDKEREYIGYKEIENKCLEFFGSDTMRFDVKEETSRVKLSDPQWDNI
ncbi:MAG: hypothetical protein PHX07_05555 [Candidatus Marinimicrobia bacterium]|nr:hypothetical protein [Candidatus Neomarinimicrobiota bacterium]